MRFLTNLTDVFKLTNKTKQALEVLEIQTVENLLYHFPSRFENVEDFSDATSSKVIIKGVIESIKMRKSFGKRRVIITEARLRTSDDLMKVVWFSQPYIAKQYKNGDAVKLIGKLTRGKNETYITNPEIYLLKGEEIIDNVNSLAIYKETKGISSKWIRSKILKILSDEEIKKEIDLIPKEIRERLNLPDIHDALISIHMPKKLNHYKVAKKRFVFEKMFLLQLANTFNKTKNKLKNAHHIVVDGEDADAFLKTKFNFKPTDAQIRVVKDITKGLNKKEPMMRLLEGDVGSGKTAVIISIIHSMLTGKREMEEHVCPQTAYMVPTEILGMQIFNQFIKLYAEGDIPIAFISSKTVLKFPSKIDKTKPTTISKVQLKKWIKEGVIPIVIGTHSLIQKELSFKRLAMVIIDEQHKFGILQRKNLTETNGFVPHLISMTATPIPRSYALTIYGDLDLSLLDEMPKGRKKVKTKLIKERNKEKVYEHMQRQIKKGRQIYILCPRINETEKSNLTSIETERIYIQERYKDIKTEIIHGKLKSKEKEDIMNKFIDGEIDVLITTTVIEVGIDVPNANTIMILNAERFGLAQLHQLRGRVIRGTHQPYCFIISDTNSEVSLERLNCFEQISDGFELSKKDFEMRGAGELVGKKQSGFTDLLMEALENKKLVEITKQEVDLLLEKDKDLCEHKELNEMIKDITFHSE